VKTIKDIQGAIDPMPAMLSVKGKSRPEARFEIRANEGSHLTLSWVKSTAGNDWDRAYKVFMEGSVDTMAKDAVEFINSLPDAATTRLHDFMSQLGKVIDSGRDIGIEVDYLNPLTETMKRLSENILTHKPSAVGSHEEKSHG
jgi:hypothetical protein